MARVFAPGRIQENILGEFFMYWFRARGYVSKTTLLVCNYARFCFKPYMLATSSGRKHVSRKDVYDMGCLKTWCCLVEQLSV